MLQLTVQSPECSLLGPQPLCPRPSSSQHESVFTHQPHVTSLSEAHVLAAACGCSRPPGAVTRLAGHRRLEPRVGLVVLAVTNAQAVYARSLLTDHSVLCIFPSTLSTSFLVFTSHNTEKVEAIRRELPQTATSVQRWEPGPYHVVSAVSLLPNATAAHSSLLRPPCQVRETRTSGSQPVYLPVLTHLLSSVIPTLLVC